MADLSVAFEEEEEDEEEKLRRERLLLELAEPEVPAFLPESEFELEPELEPEPESFESPIDSLEEARSITPEAAVQIHQDAATLGVDYEMVRESAKESRAAAQRVEDALDLGEYDVTRSFLTDPMHAAVASDSVKQLGWLEGMSNAVVRSYLNVQEMYAYHSYEEEREDYLDPSRTFTQILETERDRHPGLVADLVFGATEKPEIATLPDTLDYLSATYRWAKSRIFDANPRNYIEASRALSDVIEERSRFGMSDAARNWMENIEKEESFLGKIATGVSDESGMAAFSTEIGVEFLPQLFLSGVVTLATRNPKLGAATMGLSSYGQERFRSPIEFLQKAGVDFTDPDSVINLLQDETLMEEAERYGATRGVVIAFVDAITGGIAGKALAENVFGDLILQTAVQMTGGGGGEALAQLASTGKIENLNEIIYEAVGELSTTPLDVTLVGGRSLLGTLRDKQKVTRAQGFIEALDQQVEMMADTPLTERDPAVAGKHLADTYRDQGVEQVYVNVSILEELENSGQVIEQLGVADQVSEAKLYDGDVVVDIEVFTREAMANPELYNRVRDGVKFQAEMLSAREAAEIDEETTQEVEEATRTISEEVQEDSQGEGESATASGEPSTVSRDTTRARELLTTKREELAKLAIADLEDAEITPDIVQEAMQNVTLAEHEAGIDAIFKTAKEAGMTENEYASYLQMHVRRRMESVKRVVKAAVRKRQKVVQKKFKEAEAKSREKARAELMEDPVWKAFHAIGRAVNEQRLSFGSVFMALGGDDGALKLMESLPRVGGRRLYLPKNSPKPGLDAKWYADFYGLDNAENLLLELLTRSSFEDAVAVRTQELMREDFGGLVDVSMSLEETMAELNNTDHSGTVIAFELARLRQMRGQKRIQRTLIKTRAKKILQKWRVGEIRPTILEQHQRLEARRAAKALREGRLEDAARHKLNQLTTYEMIREAYKIQKELVKGNKFLKKYAKEKLRRRGKVAGIPIEYREQIRTVLDAFNFKARSASERRLQRSLDDPGRNVERLPGESLSAWASRKRDEQGIIVDLGPTVLQADGSRNWESLTYAEWADIKNTVKAIETAGKDANKQRREIENVGIDEIVTESVVPAIENNLRTNRPDLAPADMPPGPVSKWHEIATTVADTWNSTRQNVASLVFNADSYLRELDAFESMGEVHKYIKGGIDRAFTEGYMPNQIGYLRRMKAASERMVDIYDMFTKSERNKMGERIKIDGVRQLLTREEVVTVILNMGNAENMAAMTTGKDNRLPQFTEMELEAIKNWAPKKYWDFAQATWDFLSEFSPEIAEATRRRQNRDAVMVEAQSIETSHGTYRGGYYPLVYDWSKGTARVSDIDIQEARDMMLKGGFTTNHTKDAHTITRTRANGTPVSLDMFNLNSHVQQVIYDLEMGDATYDAWRVLNHQDVRQAFADAGRTDVHQTLNLWMDDVITGEQHRGDVAERALRAVRIGTTISKLAFNLTTAALQPLGLLQSASLVGKKNIMMGIVKVIGSPIDIWGYVASQSGFMAEREQSFNKDIQLARQGVRNGLLERAVGTRNANTIRNTYFLFIAKMQRFVDVVTWLGARAQGTEMFGNDEARAIAHADRMVARTQGSGNFHERTPFERGTISKGVRNTELVRAWSVFYSYFGAKANVAWERTRTTNFRNPLEVANYMTDIALLYFVEGVAAAYLKNGLEWPIEDEDGDESEWDDFLSMMALEGVKNFASGVPLVREVVSAMSGFPTGGAPGGFISSTGRAIQELASEDEYDFSTAKAVNNALGIVFRYPTSQVHKTGQTMYEDLFMDGEHGLLEYVTGPPRN